MYAELVTRSLYEFLTCFIHLFAYKTQTYPLETFKLTQIYNTATYQSNHPQVIQWVETASKTTINALYQSKSKSGLVSIILYAENKPKLRVCIQLQDYEVKESKLTIEASKVQMEFAKCIQKLLSADLPHIEGNKSLNISFQGELEDVPIGWTTINYYKPKLPPNILPIGAVRLRDDQQKDQTLLVLNIYTQKL